jgi:hypothetical protein
VVLRKSLFKGTPEEPTTGAKDGTTTGAKDGTTTGAKDPLPAPKRPACISTTSTPAIWAFNAQMDMTITMYILKTSKTQPKVFLLEPLETVESLAEF